ncbi:FUSC family protein [Actinoplanes sp. CA-142083]|uniref:FUSC family protein n=1 Tax=Actinoplanes sp. CA-142083 TaxID=3239903 RepID=UPI003D8F5166
MPRSVGPEVRAATRLRPVDAAWAFALRAGLAVAIPLVTLVAADRPSWAGVATFGAFTALYARDEPYRRRARVLTAAAAGLVACVVIGTLVEGSGPGSVVAVALVGGVATLVCGRFRVGPPGGLMFAFATAVTSALPAGAGGSGAGGAATLATWSSAGGNVWRNAALCAGSAALAWLIAMAGALVDRDAPMRLAVARALRAAATLAAAPGGPAGLQARYQAALAVEKAWRAVPASRPAEALLVAHAETELSGPHGHDPAVAAQLRTLADAAAKRGPAPALTTDRGEADEVRGRRMATLLLRDPLRRAPGPLLPAAARVAAGALAAGAVAGMLAHLTGLGHPYWAALSAVAVLQADSLRLTLQKAMQRAAGTILGLFLAGAAVALPGGKWTLVASIAIAQVVAELLVVRNYGLAMLAITPLALLVGELGRPTPPMELIGDRLVQTLLGCALGLAAAALVRNRAAARHLEDAINQVAAATSVLRREPAGATGEARRLALLLLRLREAYVVASGEPGLAPDATERVLKAERAARQALVARH